MHNSGFSMGRTKPEPSPDKTTDDELTPEEEAEAIAAAHREFQLTDAAPHMVDKGLPEFLDLRDPQIALALMGGTERNLMDNMVSYFLTEEGIKADERQSYGPSRWQYSDDPFDNFDYYAMNGCPNCGAPYDLDNHYSFSFNPPALVCVQCGHRACPLHFENESDTLVDRLQGHHLSASDKLARKSDGTLKTIFNTDASEFDDRADKARGAVYLRGARESCSFGQTSKDWWQNYYLPKDIRMREVKETMRIVAAMGDFKAPTVNEDCEVCGNGQSFFHTFQARSADEGATIMYECTLCHSRRVVNT